ncbi:hypothetical protein COCON_G00202800 [Conger conger]|uniref:PH domain-containing protein n=1 Tax=Conger conger TaxID=82655 RepID=A0A9Q1CZJ3_CONCO|nr:hypothetical protein COCON_G00202800 [Conger conger]
MRPAASEQQSCPSMYLMSHVSRQPCTLPQGTIDMRRCSAVLDGQPHTGQRHSLVIRTPDRDHFIRAEDRETIHGWQESLLVFPRANKHNLKKKRKVESPVPRDVLQDPGPAREMVICNGGQGGGAPCSHRGECEEQRSPTAVPCSHSAPCLHQLEHGPLPQNSSSSGSLRDHPKQGSLSGGRSRRVESGYFSLEKIKPDPPEGPPRYTSPDPDPLTSPQLLGSLCTSPSFTSLTSPDSEVDATVTAPPSREDEVGLVGEPTGQGGGGPMCYASLADVPKAKRLSHRQAFSAHRKRLEQRARSPGREEVARLFGLERRRSQVIEKFESLEGDNVDNVETSSSSCSRITTRQGRNERRHLAKNQEVSLDAAERSMPDVSWSSLSSNRRTKSLDRKAQESSITPDLLNFKKGWMTKLQEDGTWKKHWFVLTDQGLRFFRDSIAEEAGELDGEIDLSTCYDVIEFPVQRNYGFQVHTKEGAFTLCAMTSGIRRNWIQAIAKNVHASNAPDVTRTLPEEKAKVRAAFGPCPQPSPESPAEGVSARAGSGGGSEQRKRFRDRRRGGDRAELHLALAPENRTAPPAGQPRDCTDYGREGAGGSGGPLSGSESPGKGPDVRVEIEQHWLQVETMLLREEKEIPMAPDPGPETPPLQPALTGNQMQEERSWQQEQSSLPQEVQSQEQSSLPQEVQSQEQSSLPQEVQSQEQSPREACVLQSELPPRQCSVECADSCRQLYQLTRDQQLQLEGLRQERGFREAEIQALRAQLSHTAAELLAREREMTLERERSRDLREEQAQGERTHQAQIRDSEDRLKCVETSLLEKTQALRDLERQQALQQGHGKEVQKLQERLSEVTARLIAAEEAQGLKEERLDLPDESWGEERRSLTEQLAEVEERRRGLEEQLRTAELQVEVLQGERCELLHRLEGRLTAGTETVQDLTEMTQQLKNEKDQLACHCQELLNQITAADNEVSKLQSRLQEEKTDYYSLDQSYQKLYEEFQRINRVLCEKEEQIQGVKEMCERQAEMKEKDLSEALVKMAALESRLETAELKLQVEAVLISGVGQENTEPCAAERDLQSKLTDAESRIAGLEQELSSMHQAYTALQRDYGTVQGEPNFHGSSSKQDDHLPVDAALQFLLTDSTHPEGFGNVSDPPLINHNPSEQNGSSEPLLESVASAGGAVDTEKLISVIHTLETKLYSTEEKLTAITHKLEEQEGLKSEAMKEQCAQLAELEEELRSQLGKSMSRVRCLSTQLQDKLDQRHASTEETSCHVGLEHAAYPKALACLELSREKVQAILRGHQECSAEMQCHVLTEIEAELFNAALYIRQGGVCLEEWKLDHQGTQNLQIKENKVSGLDGIKLSAKMLEFEALVLKRMAYSMQNPITDVLQGLREIHQEAENLKTGDESYMAIVYADVLVRKLMLECEFWDEVEKLEVQSGEPGDLIRSARDSAEECSAVTSSTCTQSNSIHNLQSFYDKKFQKLRSELLEARANLECREVTLKEVIRASKKAWLGQGLSEGLACRQGTALADNSPPELNPYFEQIKVEEARDLAEEIISKHLQIDVLTCSIEAIDSPRVGQERLATELKVQAEVLQHLSSEMVVTYETEPGSLHPSLVNVFCAKHYKPARDLRQCNKACESMGFQGQENGHSVGGIHECCVNSLQEECQSLSQAMASLQKENQTLRQEVSQYIAELSQQEEQSELLEERRRAEADELKALCELEISEAEQRTTANELSLMDKMADCQHKLEVLLLDIEGMEDRHEGHVRKLEARFQRRVAELQRAHREEVEQLQGRVQTLHTVQGAPDSLQARHPEDLSLPELAPPPHDRALPPSGQTVPAEGQAGETGALEMNSMAMLRQRIQELETQVNSMQDQLGNRSPGGDVSSLKENYQKDLENLKSTCERGFTAMEEMHQKLIEEIQRQHQREVSHLLEERERLLAEETAATISAIEALKNAHREELEKSQRSELSRGNADIQELREQYREEVESVQRELGVLSEQYSHKCLENADLTRSLEAEKQALSQCQRENQELSIHIQELNNRLTVEITRMRSCLSGEGSPALQTQGKDLYELEVLLRVKDSEIQYLKQEIHSLKDELQAVLRDKKYAAKKYADAFTELSIVRAKAGCDISKLKEQLRTVTGALGERAAEAPPTALAYDILKSKSSPDFLPKEPSVLRAVRSKCDVEQVSWSG